MWTVSTTLFVLAKATGAYDFRKAPYIQRNQMCTELGTCSPQETTSLTALGIILYACLWESGSIV